jgi:hypothetical protein
VLMCHTPPGNPEERRSICVGRWASCAHKGHGDTFGPCE